MKKCSYCGRDIPEDSDYCLECGTAFNSEPASSQTAPRVISKPVIAILTVLAIYLPYSWVLVGGPRGNPSPWIRMWPELPGFVLYYFSFLFLGLGKWDGPEWLFHLQLLAISGLFAWVMIDFAIKFRHRAPMAILVIIGVSGLLGLLAYGMYKA